MARLPKLLREDPVRSLAWVLAMTVSTIVATEGKDFLQGSWPDVFRIPWVWLVTATSIFSLSTVLLFGIIRPILWWSLSVAVRRWDPDLIARHIPDLIAGSSATQANRVPNGNTLVETVGEQLAKREFDSILRLSFPAVTRQFQSLRKELTAKATSNTVESIRAMSARWIPTDIVTGPPQVAIAYADPIHGTVEFPEKFTWLLTHPTLQRLNEVRQLPLAFPRYPGGTHTRFSHSVGAAHLARTVMQRVINKGVIYTASGRKQMALSPAESERLVSLATVCGLVHDIGHAPLGHTLDRFFRTQFFEGEGTSDADKEFFPRTLEALAEPIRAIDGLAISQVKEVLAGEEALSGWLVFVSQLVNSKLDVDRLDYLQRDAHFTGQLEGLLNIEALLASIRPFEADGSVFLTFDESYLGDIEQFVYARDVMYLRCYEHRAKVVSEALAARAVHRLFEIVPELRSNLYFFASLSDAQLLEVVNGLPGEEEGGPKDLFQRVFRSEALAYVEVDSIPFVKPLVGGWLGGLLVEFTYASETLMDKVLEAEKKIAREAGLDVRDVVIVLPDPKANEERSMALDINVLARAGGGFRAIPLISDKDESSPSEILQRSKFVAKEVVDAASSLREVQEAAAKGTSLLGIIRRARFKLRLFVHVRKIDKRDAVVQAFAKLRE